jgi:hypothetical protein
MNEGSYLQCFSFSTFSNRSKPSIHESSFEPNFANKLEQTKDPPTDTFGQGCSTLIYDSALLSKLKSDIKKP